MQIWRVQVGEDVFTKGEPLPRLFCPSGVEGLKVEAIFQRGVLVEDEIEIEEERTTIVKEDGTEAEEGEEGEQVVTRSTRTEYSMRETPVPGKTLVFVLPEKGTAWHPDQNAFKGAGRGMFIELTHSTEEDTRVPFVVRVAPYNEIVRNVKATRDMERAAYDTVKRAMASEDEAEEVPKANGAAKPSPAEGNA